MAGKTGKNRIRLAGVRLNPRIGVTPEEREIPQECEGDITLWVDFGAAAAMDSPESAIDYCRVLSAMQRTAAAGEYRLLETLATRIARSVLGEFPVMRVRLKLRKRPASLRGQLDFVEVDVAES